MSSHATDARDAVRFSAAEEVDNNKVALLIQNGFYQNHPEITAQTTSDLAKMMREEKVMYSNLAIQFAVRYMAALEKQKDKHLT